MLLYLREEELVFAKKNPPSGPNIFPDYISSRWKIFFSLLCILTGVLIFLGGKKDNWVCGKWERMNLQAMQTKDTISRNYIYGSGRET